jgi:hypothetical protein
VTAARSIAGNRFGGDGGGQVIHHRPVAGFGSRLRSAVNNLEKGINNLEKGITVEQHLHQSLTVHAVPASAIILAGKEMANGLFQFAFTNNPSTLLAVLTTTNMSLPLSNWNTPAPPRKFPPASSASSTRKRQLIRATFTASAP